MSLRPARQDIDSSGRVAQFLGRTQRAGPVQDSSGRPPRPTPPKLAKVRPPRAPGLAVRRVADAPSRTTGPEAVTSTLPPSPAPPVLEETVLFATNRLSPDNDTVPAGPIRPESEIIPVKGTSKGLRGDGLGPISWIEKASRVIGPARPKSTCSATSKSRRHQSIRWSSRSNKPALSEDSRDSQGASKSSLLPKTCPSYNVATSNHQNLCVTPLGDIG